MYPLWNFFIEKRQFTILVIIGLTIWGTAAALLIRKESAPEVQIPVGIVSTVLPGASAADVERLVTNKLEEHLANLSDLDSLTSTSRDGVSIITAQFLASANLEKSIQKLKDEVDKAKIDLPSDAKDPSVTDINFADQPIQLVSVTTDLPFAKLATLGEDLKRELSGIKGISRIEVSGARDREVDVVVKKEELARRGMSLSDVTNGIAQSNAAFPIGAITTSGITYDIAFEGGFEKIDDFGTVPILTPKGETVYLRDIATISDGVQKATSYSRISVAGTPSQQALTLSVFKVRGADVTHVTKDVRTKLTELQKPNGLLDGSAVLITNDTGERVQKDLTELTKVGLETVVLVMLCLFVTIGWREAIIAGLSVPLSFLIAFVGLLYSGNTINFVSLFSLILAIGILVDSGIVVVEAIHTRTFLYGDKKRAAQETLREYGWPLIGGTMTSIVVFAPLFFISGIVGKFIASIPFTLIFVLIASIIVALGLIPTLAVIFARPQHTEWSHKQEEYAEKARQWYGAFLRRMLNNRPAQKWFLRAMAAAFVIALTLPVLGVVKTSFFPQDDGDFIFVDVEAAQGTTLAQTDLTVRAVEEALYDDKRIASFTTTVGASSAFSNDPSSGAKLATITINLPPTPRKFTSTEIVESLKEKLADIHEAKITVSQPSGGPPVGAPVLVTFSGVDRDSLDTALDQGAKVLATIPGVTDLDTSNTTQSTQYSLTIDRAKLSAVGLTPAQVAGALRTAVSGTTATKITGGEKDVDVVVSLNLNPSFVDPHDAANVPIDALRQIPLTNRSGATVLLGSVIKEGLSRENGIISHKDRKRTGTLTANVKTGYTVPETVAAFQKAMKTEKLPDGVSFSIGGENEETNKSFAEMGLALLGGLALMFIVLVLAFNSFRFTTYLLIIVPLSLIGVIGGLAISRQYLSFSSLLGVIALAGVIINHAIILMDAIIKRLRAHRDMAFIDIVIDAATSRLRPIVLTTVTTVVGMIPLTGASALWGPLAFAVMFGLAFAMILTLVLIPVLVYRWPGSAILGKSEHV